MSNNIHPDFEKFVSRNKKEKLINQKAKVLWFTGLSGSGKSSIAAGLDNLLLQNGYFTAVLDGDNVRVGINSNLGFSDEDRNENIRRIAEIAKLMVENGIITICCFVSPLKSQRELAKAIIGKDDFLEIFVNTSLEICEKRDIKGLYDKARKGMISNFTGVNSPFEVPQQADLEIKTDGKKIEENSKEVYNFIRNLIN